MEVFLYNSTVCRLCGEENDNGTFLYSSDDNTQNISELVNAYLPIKVSDDGQLPRTICPGCTIQLEATIEFINLIINGQKIIRSLHQREKAYKKTVYHATEEENVAADQVVTEVNETVVYSEDHPIALQVSGLDKPKRKRGRPPKKPKSPEELAQEVAAKEQKLKTTQKVPEEPTGKRRRKTPERFKEVVQGKELEKIFIEEGVTDGEEEVEIKTEIEVPKEPAPKIPEVIGHTESGELVVVVKGKGRGRPKGRLRPTREKCAICGKEFSNSGRYMSHVASHGPVLYQCQQCSTTFQTRLEFNNHQVETSHQGQKVLPYDPEDEKPKLELQEQEDPLQTDPKLDSIENVVSNGSLPVLETSENVNNTETTKVINVDNGEEETEDASIETVSKDKDEVESPTKSKNKLKCPHCDKKYSSKQSKSLHIKVAHKGERAYICSECGAAFAYPRALALHKLAHARRKPAYGFACDLCGKVLNHPSSVAYHKAAEHAGQRYMCNKCGKSFKHRQLLQRHQLVHSHHRPYACKICNAKFKTKANLLNHQLLHSGVKRFSCDICKQRFAHKTSLTLHTRWHNGQKPYVCKTCGKAFSQKGNLSEHVRIHTGEKPFRCDKCDRRFTTSSQHRLHLRRHEMADCIKTKSEAATATAPATAPAPVSRATVARPDRRHTHTHKQMNKSISIVHEEQCTDANESVQQQQYQIMEDPNDEGVIYVSFEVEDDNTTPYQILDQQQNIVELESPKPLPQCEVFAGESLLLQEHNKLQDIPLQLHAPEPMTQVTDEQGNPLHFTMQDGTRLAITSFDGHSLHVITQDGQTIPVEINGFTPEEQASL